MGPLHISGIVKARNFKFGMQIDHDGSNEKCNIKSNRIIRDHVTYFLKFWDPLHISGTAKVKNFKFGTHIEHERH